MKLLTRFALILSFVLAASLTASVRAADGVDYETLIWLVPSQPERVAAIILERVKSFNEVFKDAYALPLSPDTTKIVVRSEPLKDTDGVEYETEMFVAVSDGQAVLTFLNLAGDPPDVQGSTLTAQLFRAIVKALDDQYKRKPSEN